MDPSFRKFLATLALCASFPNPAAFAADGEKWECPAKEGAYVGQVCQCLEARRPGGA